MSDHTPSFTDKKINSWIKRRLPRSNHTVLDRRKIFIVPTRLSLVMLALVLTIYIIGNLFENTMAYAVSFWLLALQLVSIFYTFRNLSGLEIQYVGSKSCFAGEHVSLTFKLSRQDGKAAHNLLLGWDDHSAVTVDVAAGQSCTVDLSCIAPKRGFIEIDKLEIQSRYPTGLAVAWSYFRFKNQTVVYPTPAVAIEDNAPDSDEDEGSTHPTPGVNHFDGVREYVDGDSPRRIHWAKYAQTQQLYTKHFEDHQSSEFWIRWSTQVGDTEARLSALCQLVLDAHMNQHSYGLQLPTLDIQPASGEAHRTACLRALALYGLSDSHA